MFIVMPPEYYEYTYYVLMIMIVFGLAFMYSFVVYELDQKLLTFFKEMFDKSN